MGKLRVHPSAIMGRRCRLHNPFSNDEITMNYNTTETRSRWGIDNDYGVLCDVLLGRPEYFRWIDAGPITQRTLKNAQKMGVSFDLQEAMAQHAEMVRIYEAAGVNCHFLEADEVLHRNFFARDSSAMTPWGERMVVGW